VVAAPSRVQVIVVGCQRVLCTLARKAVTEMRATVFSVMTEISAALLLLTVPDRKVDFYLVTS
jgi:hypothetical protein